MFVKIGRLGQGLALIDIVTLGLFGSGAMVTLLDLVGVWDINRLKAVEMVILLMLDALILYTIQEKWGLARKLSQAPAPPSFDLARGEEAVFQRSIAMLGTRRLDVVYIYAPVGLWRASEARRHWFEALSQAISAPDPSVCEIRAVFGLPPGEGAFAEVFAAELAPFAGQEAARLRYLPPPEGLHAQLPGTGMVILGDAAVAHALAAHGHHTVSDSAVVLQSPEAIEDARLWFDAVWEAAHDHPLQDSRHGITLAEGMQTARQAYITAA